MSPNKDGEYVPWQKRVAAQVDYLFASKVLADRLDSVIEVSPDEWELHSDHRPIIVKFRAE